MSRGPRAVRRGWVVCVFLGWGELVLRRLSVLLRFVVRGGLCW